MTLSESLEGSMEEEAKAKVEAEKVAEVERSRGGGDVEGYRSHFGACRVPPEGLRHRRRSHCFQFSSAERERQRERSWRWKRSQRTTMAEQEE